MVNSLSDHRFGDQPQGKRGMLPSHPSPFGESGLREAPIRGATPAKKVRSGLCPKDALPDASFFVRPDTCASRTGSDAETHRYLHHPHHRRRPHRHRPGLRVRLLRHAGVQDAEGRRLPGGAGQFQSGDDHDRSRSRRRHLYRADHPGDRRQDHRQGAPRGARRLRAAADHGRPDRAQLRAVAAQDGRARRVRRRDDRRHGRGHRQGRGPRAVPRRDDQDRPRHAALAPDQDLAAGS